MPDLEARLDKMGRYVLCGRVNCGGRLASVCRFSDEEIEIIREEARARDPSIPISVIDHIAFPPGWAPSRGHVWKLSSYARERTEWGVSPNSGGTRPGNDGMIPNMVVSSAFDPLPVTAVCPTCVMANAILPEIISVNLALRIPLSP